MKNICYHTRLCSDNTKKIVGGSFGGSLDMDTIARLVKAHFTVTVKPSGHPVFVDKDGREVSLYVNVDPKVTDAGKEALRQYHVERQKREAINERVERQHQETIENLMSGLSNEEIIRRLGG
jgi:DNA-binding protein YbaB